MRTRITPSLVLSILALTASLGGGTAFAAKYIITSTKQIKPSVRRALKGNRGPRGVQGLPGAPGTALGFAYVRGDDTIDPGRSKAITQANLTIATQGVYCFRGLGFIPRSVTATLGVKAGTVVSDFFIAAEVGPSGIGAGSCPPDTNATVLVQFDNGSTQAPASHSFYILLN